MPPVLHALQHRCLIGDFDVNGVYEYDRGAPARIDAAAENGVIHQFVRGDAKASDDALTERILGVLERQLNFGESEHGCWLERLPLKTDARGREHPARTADRIQRAFSIRCFSRCQSRSLSACRLSCCFLPFARPTASFILPRLKCISSGSIV